MGLLESSLRDKTSRCMVDYAKLRHDLHFFNQITKFFVHPECNIQRVSFQPYTQITNDSFMKWFWRINENVSIVVIVLQPSSASNGELIHSFKKMNLRQFYFLFRYCNEYLEPMQMYQQSLARPEKRRNSNVDDEKLCCICMDKIADNVLACTHLFCETCITDWGQISDSCPVCRAKNISGVEGDSWVITKEMKDLLNVHPEASDPQECYEAQICRYYSEYLRRLKVFPWDLSLNTAEPVHGGLFEGQ